ncbi:MAG: UDP-N-acetylmuramoyl-L-alanine--D-glutamate ligase, partial [Coriobacteriaceae bacterium]|nr:UDP-N-acetylmuramoyl-L-alanine--D-glutamate ligase [Coriobacteriaceae bacterium]
LSWHGSYAEYVKAKKALFRCMKPDAPRIIDATTDETHNIITSLAKSGCRSIAIGSLSGLEEDMPTPADAREMAFLRGDNSLLTIVLDGIEYALVAAAELQIRGEHNQLNALAASAAALLIGVSIEDLREGLRSFVPLEHRIEPCGVVAGREFFNDSKATNPEATIKALSAFTDQSVVLLLGGRDKGTDLSELVAACEGKCRAVICYGEAQERFSDAFRANSQRDGQSTFSLIAVDSFAQAFSIACTIARPGDVVLLSPACASFDEFTSFEHRGEVFKSLVRELGSSDGQGQ